MDFVKTVCRSSEGDGYRVFQSEGDANTGIVSETTKLATEGYLVTVIAHDTDILFLFHSPPPHTWLTIICIRRDRTLGER